MLPPWTEDAVQAYRAQAEALCACASQRCRGEAQLALQAIDGQHGPISGIALAGLQAIDKMLYRCQQ